MSSLDLGVFGWDFKYRIVLSSRGKIVNPVKMPGLARICRAGMMWQHAYGTAGFVCLSPGGLGTLWRQFSGDELVLQ